MVVDYARINDLISQYSMSLWEIERKLIGIDHAQVGGLMAEKWNLPAGLTEAIRYHHYPAEATNPILPAIVNLANSLTLHRASPKEGLFANEISPETLEILGIKPNVLLQIGELAATPVLRDR